MSDRSYDQDWLGQAYDTGFGLNDAWAHFASQGQTNLLFDLRAAQPFAETDLTLRAKSELSKALRAGELIAIHLVRLTFPSGRLLDVIPREKCLQHLFAWEAETLKDGGIIYRNIRIIRRRSQDLSRHVVDGDGLRGPPVLPSVDAGGDKRAKMGRPTVLPEILAIVDKLMMEPDPPLLRCKSVKERENLVRMACRQAHPLLFARESTPSRGKVLEALKLKGLSSRGANPRVQEVQKV